MKDKDKDESVNPDEAAETENDQTDAFSEPFLPEDSSSDPGTTDSASELAGDVTTRDVP